MIHAARPEPWLPTSLCHAARSPSSSPAAAHTSTQYFSRVGDLGVAQLLAECVDRHRVGEDPHPQLLPSSRRVRVDDEP